LALVGAGCWAFSEKNRLSEASGVSDVHDSLRSKYSDVFDVVFDLTILVITLAIFIFVLSFVGCVGALRDNTCFLKCVRTISTYPTAHFSTNTPRVETRNFCSLFGQ